MWTKCSVIAVPNPLWQWIASTLDVNQILMYISAYSVSHSRASALGKSNFFGCSTFFLFLYAVPFFSKLEKWRNVEFRVSQCRSKPSHFISRPSNELFAHPEFLFLARQELFCSQGVEEKRMRTRLLSAAFCVFTVLTWVEVKSSQSIRERPRKPEKKRAGASGRGKECTSSNSGFLMFWHSRK